MIHSLFRHALILMLVVTSLGGSLVLAGGHAQDAPVLGAVNIIVSRLFITEPGAQDEDFITSPTVFDPGEMLRTDETGVALITWFYDGTETAVGPGTRLTLNAFEGGVAADFTLDLAIEEGHIGNGLGDVAAGTGAGNWMLTTPAFVVKLIRGQFEVTVDADGNTLLIVTEGRVEVYDSADDDTPLVVDENQYIQTAAAPMEGDVKTLSDDGITVNLEGACTGVASTNTNIRLAPSENSRRLGAAPQGQVLWVRAGTEGNLWVQVYFQTDQTDEEGHNYGWIYGPALTLDEEACANLIRAELAAHLYGGQGIDSLEGEATEEAAAS